MRRDRYFNISFGMEAPDFGDNTLCDVAVDDGLLMTWRVTRVS